MIKKTFSIILTIIMTAFIICTPFSVGAYEVTEYEIKAKAGMLASLDTGEILYSNNIDQKVYPASLTKIMTVILILESDKYDPNARVTMTKDVLNLTLGTGSAVSGLKDGEEISQLDLIYLILMASYGDCADLGAVLFGGSIENFVNMMNQKAVELGLSGTNYTNPIGLHDENNYTTVNDVYTLTKYALKNETFKTVCETPRYSMAATNKSPQRTLSTTNLMQDSTTTYFYQYAKGVKTGYTDEAGRCLVSTASYKEYNYLCILMNCPPNAGKRYEFEESANLYRWAFKNFSFKEAATSKDPVCEMPVNLSLESDHVPLYLEKPFVSVLPNEADDSTIVIETHLNSESTDAPVSKGDVLGTADIIYAEQVIGTVNLVAKDDIKQSKLLLIFSYVKNIFNSIYMKVLIGFAVIAVLIFIALIIRLNIARLKKRRVKYIPYNGKEREGKSNHER